MHLFAFKRGSSAILETAYDPIGLHSWIETGGWAIDASNGGVSGRPALIMRAESFYSQMQLMDIRDIPEGAGTLQQPQGPAQCRHGVIGGPAAPPAAPRNAMWGQR
jgi:hypothetical protein